eukprot:s1272_g5.t1
MKRSNKSLALDPQNIKASGAQQHIPPHGKTLLKSGALDPKRKQQTAKARARKVPDTQPGFLRRARLRKDVTRQSYESAWNVFMSFCVESQRLPGPGSRFVSMHQLDLALEAFGEQQFLSGGSKYVFTCALQNANIQYPAWPTSSRTNYPLSKSAKKGWGNLEPGQSRDPCPFEVACLISQDLVIQGQAQFAAAVMLSFDTYMRPGKICELVHSNIVPPTRGISSKYSFWTLLLHPQERGEPSKVGEFNDSLVVGSGDRSWVGAVLGRLYSRHPGHGMEKVFNFTLHQFENQFRACVQRLGLEKLKLTPHCLRHGGASHDYLMQHRSLPDIQQRGCWKSVDSVRRYAKHGRISRQLNLLSTDQQTRAKQASIALPRQLLNAL